MSSLPSPKNDIESFLHFSHTPVLRQSLCYFFTILISPTLQRLILVDHSARELLSLLKPERSNTFQVTEG